MDCLLDISYDDRFDPIVVKDLCRLRVLLLQPENRENEELSQHLNRIGCLVRRCWPPPVNIQDNVDVVLISAGPLVEDNIELNWDADDPSAVLIAVVDYENPIVVEKMLRLRVQAVIGLPLQTFGVLATVLLSVNNHRREARLRLRAARLAEKLRAQRDIDKAKSILMAIRSIPEDAAYNALREQAMNKRTTIEAIASAVVNANEMLHLLPKDKSV